MGIPDLVRRRLAAEEERESDLVNAEPPCECGGACCGSPLIDPSRPGSSP